MSAFEWLDDGLCQQTDPDAFFPEKGGSARAAKRVCMACPVRTDCLDYALTRSDPGIWGGKSEDERRAIKASRVEVAA